MSNSSSKGTALVTGASRGIGAVYADCLAKRGYDLILVARSEARIKELSARLMTETGRLVTTLAANLNNKVDLAKVETTLSNDRYVAGRHGRCRAGWTRPGRTRDDPSPPGWRRMESFRGCTPRYLAAIRQFRPSASIRIGVRRSA